MQAAILVTEDMRLVKPQRVGVTRNFGRTQVMFEGDGVPNKIIIGDHMIIDGDPEVIQEWLRPFSPVAVGEGMPQEERFVMSNVK